VSEYDYDPPLTLPMHATTMGRFGMETPDREVRDWQRRHSEGRICPVCLETISNTATTCSPCCWQWRKIKATPRLLAEWIVDVAQHERAGVRHLRLWERGVTEGLSPGEEIKQ